MDRNISLTYHYGMLKPYTKTNTGLEVQAKLCPNSHILILNGHAWGIQNDASWETCFTIIIKLNCFGKYKENINCPASEFRLLTAHCPSSLKCMKFCLLKASIGWMFWTILRHAMKLRPSKITQYSTKQLLGIFLPFPHHRA